MRLTLRFRRRSVLVILIAIAFASVLAPSAYAIDPQDTRPYWTGVPSGGVFQECAGQIVAFQAYGLVPARSTYTETRYSSGGGFCNNALQRPIGMIEARAITFSQDGVQCDNQFRQNQSSTAWNVIATAANCQYSGTGFMRGTSRYENFNAGHPQHTVYAP